MLERVTSDEAPAMEGSGRETTRPAYRDDSSDGIRENAQLTS